VASLANLVNETNGRFWAQTGHKRGQRLDMSDPNDRAMAKVWLTLYAAVLSYRDSVYREARRMYGESFTPNMLIFERPDGSRGHTTFANREHLDVQYNWAVDQIDTYKYIAAFDFTQDPNAPIHDSFSPYAYEWDRRQSITAGAWPQAIGALRRRPQGPWRPPPRPY
jgi:hypothetical protein